MYFVDHDLKDRSFNLINFFQLHLSKYGNFYETIFINICTEEFKQNFFKINR